MARTPVSNRFNLPPGDVGRVAASFLAAALASGFIVALSWALLNVLNIEDLAQTISSHPILIWSSLLSVICLSYAAWRPSTCSRLRMAWGIMAFAQALTFFGNIFGLFFAVPQYDGFFITRGDYFVIVKILAAVGIFLLPNIRLSHRDLLKVVLDTGIVTIASAMFFPAFWTGLILMPGSELTVSILTIYPVIDILILYGLLRLLYHDIGSPQRVPTAILLCAFLVGIAGDVIPQINFISGISAGHMWTVFFLLLGLAGIWYAEIAPVKAGSEVLARLQTSFTQYLPSISIIIAYLLLAYAHTPAINDTLSVLIIGMGGVITLATVRQILTINENNALWRAASEEISFRKAAEEKYRDLVENSLQGMMIIQGGSVVFANQAMADMTGYSVGELTRFSEGEIWSSIHDDDIEELKSLYNRCCNSPHQPFRCDFRVIREDGRLGWYEVRAVAVNYSGKPAIQGTFVEITERKLAEEALAQNEERYRNLFENAPVSIWDLDISKAIEYLNATSAAEAVDLKDHLKANPGDIRKFISLIRVLDANAMSLKIFQSESKEELISRFEEVVLPESFRSLEDDLFGLAEERRITDGEISIKTMKGERRILYWKSLAVPGYSDAISRMLVTVVDITERITMEDALKEKEAKYRRLVEGSPDVIYSYSSKQGGMFYSSRVQSILGYSPDHMVKNPFLWRDLIHPEDLDRVMAAITSLDPEKNLDVEYRIKDSKGRWHWINDRSINRHALGDEVFTEGLATDITERKIAEEMIKSSLHEKEVLLKEVHHRVKNNLQVVSSLIRLQSRRVKDKDALEAFRESQNRITSMSIIHEMLYQSPDLSRIRFDYYARSLIRFLRGSYGSAGGIEFMFDMEDVMLDLNKAIPCGLIINELVSNCMKHAFPDGRNGHVYIKMHAQVEGDIVLTVRDDGIGLPEDMDLRTKQPLGMTLIKSLVDQIKGEMEVFSGLGAEFCIEFPS